MQNAAHIAGKNVLIFAICLARLLGGRLRAGLRRRRQRLRRHGRLLPSVDAMTRSARSRSTVLEIPGAAGYLFEVVFAGVSLAIVWGAMAERAKLWVYFAFGVFFTVVYRSPRTGSGAATAGSSAGMQDFAGSTVVHYQGRSPRSPARAARAADRQVRHRRRPTRSRGTTCPTPYSGR